MCGITIFLSKNNKNIVSNIIQSLNKIQNRGYDSAGLALYSNNWQIYRYASQENISGLKKLTEKVKELSSIIGMGHTRWATHGSKTDVNSHPHHSMSGNIIIVHNGIISNYQEIKTFLIEQKYSFYSDTDTEVIANLIEYYFQINNVFSAAIELALDKLQGTWALGIINTREPYNIYITRHGSPLLLGYNENMLICTSEPAGFNGEIYNYITLENKDIITINPLGYISQKEYTINWIETNIEDRSPYPFLHWTMKEINEQPKTILSALNNGARILDNNIILGGLTNLETICKLSDIKHILVIGCGTSYHASLFAKYYFNNSTKCNLSTVQTFDASEFSEIDLPKQGKILCILCSQSGETRDLIKCIDICRANNCILLGVVNTVGSYIAQNVDCGVYMNAGREVAVASTKSFTSTTIILSLIGMWFREKHLNLRIINTLRNLPNTIEKLLEDNVFREQCNNIAEYIVTNKIHSIFILGKEKLYPIAREGSLKIKEITYIHAEGYCAGSLKHGPFALLDNKTVSLLLIDDKNKSCLLSTYHEIVSRNTTCYIITDSIQKHDINGVNNILSLPKLEHYQEIIFAVTLQYLSYLISIKRNIDPDIPRNLAKVVTVE